MRCLLRALLLLAIACCPSRAFAQGPVTWTWAQQTGGTLRDFGTRISAASAGAVYQTGSFRGTITCGTTTLTTTGSQDMYLVKYDSQGNVLWVRQANSQFVVNGGSAALGTAIVADAVGNVYVTGSFTGRVTFGSTVLTSPTSTLNTFIVKYNPQGTPQWARLAGGTAQTEAFALALDATGGLVVAGSFFVNTSFGGTILTSQGSGDIFLAKLDASTGTTQWSQSAGGQQYDFVTDVAIGAGNAINLAGGFSATAVFGPITVLSNGGIDGYLAQYTTQGAVQWVQGFGGSGEDSGAKIVVTPTNEIYSAGYFSGQSFIGPVTLTSQGSFDGYLLKADSQGAVLWVRQMGGLGLDRATNLALSSAGAVYVSGSFNSTANVGTQTLNTAGGTDIFVARYNPVGQLIWATRAGGIGDEYDSGLAIGGNGTLYLGGAFTGVTQFGTLSLASRGGEDAFMCQFTDNIPTAVRYNTTAEQITLFPNPVEGSALTLNVSAIPQGPITIDLLDVTGRQIQHLQVKELLDRRIMLDTHLLAVGRYSLRYMTGDVCVVKPFTIL